MSVGPIYSWRSAIGCLCTSRSTGQTIPRRAIVSACYGAPRRSGANDVRAVAVPPRLVRRLPALPLADTEGGSVRGASRAQRHLLDLPSHPTGLPKKRSIHNADRLTVCMCHWQQRLSQTWFASQEFFELRKQVSSSSIISSRRSQSLDLQTDCEGRVDPPQAH